MCRYASYVVHILLTIVPTVDMPYSCVSFDVDHGPCALRILCHIHYYHPLFPHMPYPCASIVICCGPCALGFTCHTHHSYLCHDIHVHHSSLIAVHACLMSYVVCILLSIFPTKAISMCVSFVINRGPHVLNASYVICILCIVPTMIKDSQ